MTSFVSKEQDAVIQEALKMMRKIRTHIYSTKEKHRQCCIRKVLEGGGY